MPITSSRWREFGGSPLVHRISLVVFLSILSIELILLGISYFGERDRLLQRVDVSVDFITPLLIGNGPAQTAATLIADGHEKNKYPLIGAAIERNDQIYLVGVTDSTLMARTGPGTHRFLDTKASIYDRFIARTGPDGTRVNIWLRFNVHQITVDLRGFVARIIGLVLAICLFVTAGCILGLHPLLIRPLMELRELMIATGESGLATVKPKDKHTSRDDELGDVFRAFDRMRSALSRASDVRTRLTDRFQDFADLGADCFFETGADQKLKFVSGDIQSLLGMEPGLIVGKTVTELIREGVMPFRHPERVVTELRENGYWEGRLMQVNERKDPKSVKIIVKYLHDDKGRECGVRGIITDVTVASDLARELRHQATHDPLTGLVNRAEFERRLNKALASFLDRMEPSVVLLLDLDRFKAVNDTCGHLAGDELLKQLSVLIGQQVRHGDVVARIGGDEFALLLTRCTIDDGAIVAEKIRAAVEKYRYVWHGESYAVGASIGAAQMENSFKNGEEVMRAADACCYKSKQEGRNRVSLYRLGDELVSSNHGEMMWLTQINQGLEENRFEIYKQPIVPVQDDAPGGEHFEVLLRLRGRDGVMLSPGEFLPAAERYGLMGSIDRWVVGKIVPWVAGRIANGATNLTVSVNLSGASASDPEFQAFLVETLGENFEATAGLCFEITESAAVKNLAGTADFLTLVQEMGCRIALDDFGTGFASMDYIKHLPLDYIKIDGAFIKNISDSPLDRALVQCVASVGRLLNVKTVGEFVESAQTIETLREVGIDYAQGYFTGKPEPLNTDDMQVNTAEVA